jgi:hypothetical protein
MHRITSAIFVVLLAPIGLAQTGVDTLGPAVGARAIPFELVDQFGKPQTIEAAAGPKGTMLVFFRSADW